MSRPRFRPTHREPVAVRVYAKPDGRGRWKSLGTFTDRMLAWETVAPFDVFRVTYLYLDSDSDSDSDAAPASGENKRLPVAPEPPTP